MIGLSLPTRLRVLCLGAHPDDVEIGCGATLLALAASREVSLTSVVLSGSQTRAAEARDAAARFVPGSTSMVLDLPDGRMPAHWERVKQTLEDLAVRERPDLIFAPRTDDAHQDHRLVAELVTTVWRHALVLRYEIPKWDGDLGRVTHYVPITRQQAARKVELLFAAYPSQRQRDWWDEETFLALMRLRGVESRTLYAEAFVVDKAVLAL